MRVQHADSGVLRIVSGLAPGLAPDAAFGRACAHLMASPAFARAPFGHVARCLAGQVNRGHYAFALRGTATAGFAGWALVSEAVAEDWLAGRQGFDDAAAGGGDCVVLNFWQADTPETSRALIGFLAAAMPGARRLYAKRHYPDGRIRPLRLGVGEAQKERRAASRPETDATPDE